MRRPTIPAFPPAEEGSVGPTTFRCPQGSSDAALDSRDIRGFVLVYSLDSGLTGQSRKSHLA
jgi:hypothetical protein